MLRFTTRNILKTAIAAMVFAIPLSDPEPAQAGIIPGNELYLVNELCPYWHPHCRRVLDQCYVAWRNQPDWESRVKKCLRTNYGRNYGT